MASFRRRAQRRPRSCESDRIHLWHWIIISFYAVALGVVLVLCALARSSQMEAAARLMTGGWVVSVAAWRVLDPPALFLVYATVDLVLAYRFLVMSRGRWFPAPLCVMHAAMCALDLSGGWFGAPREMVALLLNRLFELALFYIGVCATYRLSVRGFALDVRESVRSLRHEAPRQEETDGAPPDRSDAPL